MRSFLFIALWGTSAAIHGEVQRKSTEVVQDHSFLRRDVGATTSASADSTHVSGSQPGGTAIPGYKTVYEMLKGGSGAKVQTGNTVTVHATGVVQETGKQFWSTKDPGQQPFSYTAGVGEVITGWDQGLLGMRMGEERKITIPAEEGYGADGFSDWGIPPGATLEFTLEVLSIADNTHVPTKTTIPGYRTMYETLKQGSGAKVQAGNTVTVHATGVVQKTGKQFWSTKDPGQQPFSYTAGVGQVITGWDQGLLGMQIGEERKITIPADEGYGAGGFPAWGIPPGATLEFTLEVLSIK